MVVDRRADHDDHVLGRAMAKNPADRFNTAGEFADARAQATGIFSPILLRAEKQFDAYAHIVEKRAGRVLNRFGIPSKRELEDLSRQVATLTRKLKTAK